MSFSAADNFPEINIEGFQVVKGDMFQVTYRRQAITLSIWNDEMSFSKAAIDALHGCERIRIEINPSNRNILIIPVTEQDKDNVRWAKVGTDGIRPRKINCIRFSRLLYKTWGWDLEMAYKAEGKVVTYNQKVLLLFDFSKAEFWKCKKAVNDE